MRIIEIKDRTEILIEQLLKVWESSVKATHLFLSDDEINSIKQYVPQALSAIPVLIIAEEEKGVRLDLWELQIMCLKCCLSLMRAEDRE